MDTYKVEPYQSTKTHEFIFMATPTEVCIQFRATPGNDQLIIL
jgi:hypothetical protein